MKWLTSLRHRKRKKISFVYSTNRTQAMAVKEEENRQQARKKVRHVPRTAVREAQVRTQGTVSPVSRETLRAEQTVHRAQEHREAVRKEEETETVTEEASREEETVETVSETVPRMARDVRQDRAKETEARVRMTTVAEIVSVAEQTVAREVRAEALKEEETETVAAAEQTVVREARADALKAEEAEITVSEDRTAEVRADSVWDRKEAVLLIPYSHRS